MTMIRCQNAHFFDPQKNSSCPHCGVQNLDMGPTRPLNPGHSQPSFSENNRQGAIDQPTIGRPGSSNRKSISIDDAVTRGHWEKQLGIKPVAGWLVAIAGPEKGRDFRFSGGRNSIGRSPENHICLASDESVSRNAHAYISYDPLTNGYHLIPGVANELVYYNEQPVFHACPIKLYDHILIGETRLMFVAMCGEHFRWE